MSTTTIVDPCKVTLTQEEICGLAVCDKYCNNDYALVRKLVPDSIPLQHLVDLRRLRSVLPHERLWILKEWLENHYSGRGNKVRLKWLKIENSYCYDTPFECYRPHPSNVATLKETWSLLVNSYENQNNDDDN